MVAAVGRGNQKSIKLLVSGLVILGSVIGAWWLIESSKVTESYLITMKDLATGSQILASDLATGELALFGIGDNYLKTDQLPAGAYLTRAISAGEAIPLSAITTQSMDDWSNLVITPSVELSSSIRPGSKVLVWASPFLDYQSFGEPSIAAIDAEVVEIRQPQGNFAQAQKSVELRVPLDALQSLLRSISNRDAIALINSGSTLAD